MAFMLAIGLSLAGQEPIQMQQSLLSGMRYRLIGPFQGGRVVAVSGVPDDWNTYYFGAASGGMWKTANAGITWTPLWDQVPEASPAIGAVAVAPSASDVVYVGTGEACIRGDVVTGNGVYKSTDAGKSWAFVGLRDTAAIGRLLVHPQNPDIVLVAALGHPFGPSSERGIFRTKDGGKSWERVLYVDDRTGGIDVQFDPLNPDVLFAAMWQSIRKPWTIESGGPGSGLYRSRDGGSTWEKLSGHGLPEGILGRIGVATTSNPSRVYAVVEAQEGGVFRSDDGGDTWQLINGDRSLIQRGFYFAHIFVDPIDPNVVYVLNTSAYRSSDGGKTFATMHTSYGDAHGLWIDPKNPKRMINGNDGGASISTDGGLSWSTRMNQPTGQMYHVVADNRFPFWLYGAQQDMETVAIPTDNQRGSGITYFHEVGGGESGSIALDPRDPNLVYSHSYTGRAGRFDQRTRREEIIAPWPHNSIGWAPADLKHRFQWTSPMLFSPHDPRVLYFAGEVLFKTTDEGKSWSAISPDLTRNDKSKQQSSGGPIAKDNSGVEVYGTIFAVAESPLQKGLIWTGTDDGLVHLTSNGGGKWENVTPRQMPEWGTVTTIEPSPFEAGVAYMTLERHRLDDFTPYIFKTADFGRNWTAITNGIPKDEYLHVIRCDPQRKGLLYAGTERGVYVSVDDGVSWWRLQLNLPVVPVHDLIVKNNDLAIATHGRAFWILDDVAPLRQWQELLAGEDVHLFAPAAASRAVFSQANDPNAGQNPPGGAIIYYYLKSGRPQLQGGMKLEILDASEHVVRTFPPIRPLGGEGTSTASLPAGGGVNRFIWDLRYEPALRIPDAPLWQGSLDTPRALPGKYKVRLTVDGKAQTRSLEVLPDPRTSISSDDLKQQFDLTLAILAKITEVHEAVLQIRSIHAQLAMVRAKPASPGLLDAASDLERRITEIEEVLIQTKARTRDDTLKYPVRLNNLLASLVEWMNRNDARPSQQNYKMFEELREQADEQLAKLGQIMKALPLTPRVQSPLKR